MTACALRIEGMEKGTTTFRNPKRSLDSIFQSQKIPTWCHKDVATIFLPGPDSERQLLLEAGAELSCIGANPKALQFFGLKFMEQGRYAGTLEKLRAWGLPNMVSPGQESLAANDHTISIKLKRPEGCGQRRLICAMDRTYLETSMQLIRTEKGPCFSGGWFMCFAVKKWDIVWFIVLVWLHQQSILEYFGIKMY